MKSRTKRASANRKRNHQTTYEKLEPRNLLAAIPIITEFMASNSSTIDDDNGNSSDWIEIYNAGNNAINLIGHSLTDNPDDITKFVFPSVVVAPQDFLIVFAATDSNPGSGNDLYTGFSLKAGGEYVGLYNTSGNVLTEFSAGGADYPAQYTDISYGLQFGSGVPAGDSYFETPTPGFVNVDPVLGVTDRVTANTAAGFYDSPFQVSLATATPGATIIYTLDGSTPGSVNGTDYSGPITISSTTNLRAATFKADFHSVPDRTWSYLFVDDVINQSPNGETPAGWPSTWGANVVDYGIDPDIIALEGPQAVKDALLAIPTWSITTDLENLFDSSTGIYANAGNEGIAWERPASVELLNPDGTEGFQANAGLRIRGGYSRMPSNPKHSFKLFFRGQYGDSNLQYPIHGDLGTDTFEKIDLRTAQNYSWNLDGNSNNNFIADYLARKNQADLGQPYTRSSWLHLYLNGQYWGLFQTQERADANFGASYFGGDKDDYDVFKPDNGRNVVVDGNSAAYNQLFQQALARAADGRTPAFVSNAAYYQAQGLNPDGTSNPNYEVLLDVDNLIAYMSIIIAGGNLDAPISAFGNDEYINNYVALRNRTGNEGFRFFVHDSEHTLWNVNENRNGPHNSSNFESGVSFFNPQWLHQQLMANDEYRIRFADHIYEAYFNDGAMTAEAQVERVNEEAVLIDQAIIAESARWGDAKRPNDPLTRQDWVNGVNRVNDEYLANRNPILLEQWRNTILELKDTNGNYSIQVAAPLFPDVDVPDYLVNGALQDSGNVDAGSELRLTSSEGTIFYTTDGTDPRLVGGGLNTNAIAYDPSTTQTTLFTAGASWKYHDLGTDLGVNWRDSGYNDTAWSSGNAQLGYGDGDEATVVSFGSNSSQKQPTTYFRKEFSVAGDDYSGALLRIKRDDGVVVYLNGTEVARNNMPSGAISYDTFASNYAMDDGNDWLEFELDPSLIVAGTNLLAVEIHQISSTSSDISFDAELFVSEQIVSPIPINDSVKIHARTFVNGTWSALHVACFVVDTEAATVDNLRVTEVHYNPAGNGDAEFIELKNITSGANATSIVLDGVAITEGPSAPFILPNGTVLGPGEYGLIVADIVEFQSQYPSVDPAIIIGEYTGKLSNSGEKIEILDATGATLLDMTYGDNDPWPIQADGVGASLVLTDPVNTPAEQLDKHYRWRASAIFEGTPGQDAVPSPGVVVNEILSHTDFPELDSIELHNPTSSPINIGGWFLSDSGSELLKYEIPASTVLAAGAYVVFDESDFNPTPSNPQSNHFSLNASMGDEVFVTIVDSFGNFVEIVDAVEFGATFNGQTFGRVPDGVGRFAPLLSNTLGQENSGAAVGPLVITEVNYHPSNPSASALAIEPTLTDDDLEFIEIHNPTNDVVDLTDWRLRGESDFDFAAGTTIGPGQTIVVVTFDPNLAANVNRTLAFQTEFGIGSSVVLLGPLSENLSNSDGRVELERPDSPPKNDPTFVPHVTVDEVLYDDLNPWPNSDGTGNSLQRDDAISSGNAATSWFGANPTPGSVSLSAVAYVDVASTISIDEGDEGVVPVEFTVTLSQSSNQVVEVDFDTTVAGFANPATAGVDFTSANGSLVFQPGETSKTVVIEVASDRLVEANERFGLALSNPSLLAIATSQANVEIVDDDRFEFGQIIDFGPEDSGVYDGAIGFGIGEYSVEIGMGWDVDNAVVMNTAVGRRGNALVRDIIFLRSGEFFVDVPNGDYLVTAYIGIVKLIDPFDIVVEGTTHTFTPPRGPNIRRSVMTTVADGQLTFEINGGAGLNNVARISGLAIEQVGNRSANNGGSDDYASSWNELGNLEWTDSFAKRLSATNLNVAKLPEVLIGSFERLNKSSDVMLDPVKRQLNDRVFEDSSLESLFEEFDASL